MCETDKFKEVTKEYIDALIKYNELLIKEIDDNVVYLHIHGITSKRIEEGKKLRIELDKAAKEYKKIAKK